MENWLVWMQGRNLAARTIGERRITLTRISHDLGCLPCEIPAAGLAAWFARPMSSASKATYRGAAHAWFAWLQQTGTRDDDPTAAMGPIKTQPGRPRPISTPQLDAVLALPLRRRTRAMVMLAAYQGLRIHEIAKLRGEDIDLAANSLTVVGKGGREDVLPLHPAIAAIAAVWPRRGYWFPSYAHPDRPLTKNAVGGAIADALRRAGASRATAHQLRHWFGTELVRADVDLRTVQTMMRHRNLATTAIYTEVDDARRQAAIMRLPHAS